MFILRRIVSHHAVAGSVRLAARQPWSPIWDSAATGEPETKLRRWKSQSKRSRSTLTASGINMLNQPQRQEDSYRDPQNCQTNASTRCTSPLHSDVSDQREYKGFPSTTRLECHMNVKLIAPCHSCTSTSITMINCWTGSITGELGQLFGTSPTHTLPFFRAAVGGWELEILWTQHTRFLPRETLNCQISTQSPSSASSPTSWESKRRFLLSKLLAWSDHSSVWNDTKNTFSFLGASWTFVAVDPGEVLCGILVPKRDSSGNSNLTDGVNC